jgi:hypothetical protein
MTEMHSDEQIYAEMMEHPVSRDDINRVRKLLKKWSVAVDGDHDASLRIVFLACINTIGTMGPAYCRVAAATLMDRAEKISPEKFDS